MAKSPNQRVVGEGVETEEQTAFLQANACDEAQGYYLSMPLDPLHLLSLLKSGLASFIPVGCSSRGERTEPPSPIPN
jgi:EAL domain-containing protein (putative c-di-GMP-specific phosphodiesterase class I)